MAVSKFQRERKKGGSKHSRDRSKKFALNQGDFSWKRLKSEPFSKHLCLRGFCVPCLSPSDDAALATISLGPRWIVHNLRVCGSSFYGQFKVTVATPSQHVQNTAGSDRSHFVAVQNVVFVLFVYVVHISEQSKILQTKRIWSYKSFQLVLQHWYPLTNIQRTQKNEELLDHWMCDRNSFLGS